MFTITTSFDWPLVQTQGSKNAPAHNKTTGKSEDVFIVCHRLFSQNQEDVFIVCHRLFSQNQEHEPVQNYCRVDHRQTPLDISDGNSEKEMKRKKI